MDEPVADAARGILDGHMVLSRDLAARNHYPCIDISQSISRLMSVVAESPHKKAAGNLREVLAQYTEAEDLINIGAYVKGSNPKIDFAIDKIDAVNQFLRQTTEENPSFESSVRTLSGMF